MFIVYFLNIKLMLASQVFAFELHQQVKPVFE